MQRVEDSLGGLTVGTPIKKSKPSLPQTEAESLYSDKLGTLVHESIERLLTSVSWEAFVDKSRGRPYIHEDVKNIDHPAAAFL